MTSGGRDLSDPHEPAVQIDAARSVSVQLRLTPVRRVRRRPIRNITVAGIGMAAMILVFVWYYRYLLLLLQCSGRPPSARPRGDRNPRPEDSKARCHTSCIY